MPANCSAHAVKSIVRKGLAALGCYPSKLVIRSIIHGQKYEIRVASVVNFDVTLEIGSIVANSDLLVGKEVVVVEKTLSSSSQSARATSNTPVSSATTELTEYATVDDDLLFASIRRIDKEPEIRRMWEDELKRKVDVFVDSFPWKHKTTLRAEGYLHAAKMCRRAGIVPHMDTCETSSAFMGDMDYLLPDLARRVTTTIRSRPAHGSSLEHIARLFLNTVRNGPGLQLYDAEIRAFFGEEDLLA